MTTAFNADANAANDMGHTKKKEYKIHPFHHSKGDVALPDFYATRG
ncbi:hypothetical protein B9479_006831 [Cryptococcus floricola]|uniref:Uncharacterized protein n=1 Tax=Cryptococcus floricola TaxID=2591691 RepID=A0A5D3AQW4_9TREE|nr:hypothetical protein B9479_006831 [Cryptococcus floricola]